VKDMLPPTLHFDYKFNKILLSGRQTALDSLVGRRLWFGTCFNVLQ